MTEHQESVAFANWLRSEGYLFYKSPSETFTKSWNQKRKNKSEGVCKGFPDYTIVLKRKSLLFIEMKKQKGPKGGMNGSVISEEQENWINELGIVPNVESRFCFGFEDAKKTVNDIENW